MITWICNVSGCNRDVSGLFGMPKGRSGWCSAHQKEATEYEERQKAFVEAREKRPKEGA